MLKAKKPGVCRERTHFEEAGSVCRYVKEGLRWYGDQDVMTESGRPILSKYKLDPPPADTISHFALFIIVILFILFILFILILIILRILIILIIMDEKFWSAEGGVEMRCLSSNSIYMIGI